MAASSFRRRASSLDGYRLLTDPEAFYLLSEEAGNEINETVVWHGAGTANVRCRVAVLNDRGERLSLRGRISLRFLECSHWMVVWGDKAHQEHPEEIRRLDLRDDHDNPDGATWRSVTHEHRWSEAEGNSWAYTPDDIPHDPDRAYVGADDYRAIFEAFAAESKIGFGPDYTWTDPPLREEGNPGLWEVP